MKTLPLHHHSKQVDYTVAWLCDAAEAGADDVPALAREAERAACRLAAELAAVDSDDQETRAKLRRAHDGVLRLLAALGEVATVA